MAMDARKTQGVDEDNGASSKKPTLFAYSVKLNEDRAIWTRIGGAWKHRNGPGYSIQLDALPLEGRIVLGGASRGPQGRGQRHLESTEQQESKMNLGRVQSQRLDPSGTCRADDENRNADRGDARGRGCRPSGTVDRGRRRARRHDRRGRGAYRTSALHHTAARGVRIK
jgi:hypothetical protein